MPTIAWIAGGRLPRSPHTVVPQVPAPSHGIAGWDELHHSGLLLDSVRLAALAAEHPLPPLNGYVERQLRRRASALLSDAGGAHGGNHVAASDAPAFVSFVLEQVCGFNAATGAWTRGSNVAAEHGRRAVTGEMVKPRQLWRGIRGARLPVFFDGAANLGLGRSHRTVSRVLGWLRDGGEHLALVTNGRQFRLVFAGLDFDAACQWDTALWFQEGELAPQVTALRTLLQSVLWTPPAQDAAPPLLQAIRDTRNGQAELSEVLGERVREAVELLIQSHGEALRERCTDVPPADIYRAACRVVMRLVIILFAESRELLPRDNALYHASYGLQGLFERLEREAVRGGAMAEALGAWPRVLALFRLMCKGSHFPDLPVPAYGGELFAPAKENGRMARGADQALDVFESACFEGAGCCSDEDVHQLLRLLTRTTMRVRQGRGTTQVAAPVDFSDLSSEYIGIVYEGLLDYELKLAPPGDPVIFLAVRDQPALPLSRLEAMSDGTLRTLFERLDTSGADAKADDPAPTADAFDEETAATAWPDATDLRQQNRTRAETWARRAAKEAGLVRKPRGRSAADHAAFEEQLASRAKRLVARVVLPGEWYLVRWGGTRKGSGTFHTRPGLAVPTVQRTLRPLAFNPPQDADGKANTDAPAAEWTPKLPEDILDLKVADPACGSGTFPLAALRFLTDALYTALQHHDRIEPAGDRALVHLLGVHDASDPPSGERLRDELIPCPIDDDTFEPRLKAVLRRHVVERCLYAVDLDPLAVELCRLSLWIETMDRTLPFGFLDHKVKCGNALIGAWFDQFAHYPAMAWKHREGGDKNHGNGVHFAKNARTQALKAFVKEQVTPDLQLFLRGRDLFQEDLLTYATSVHDDTLEVLEGMHAMPIQDAKERAATYRERFLGSPAWRSLKQAMDLWCACWFWPAEELESAPLPTTFAAPSDETRTVAARLAQTLRFFHWELEFPDVFRGPGAGFDAMLGNPPWENSQPNPEEFFSNADPLFRTYGRLAKQRRQTELFEAIQHLERNWLDYLAGFKNLANWYANRSNPSGDPAEGPGAYPMGKGGKEFHTAWRQVRARSLGYSDNRHPYRHQMGRLFTYKLFMEQYISLLRVGGRCGVIVPSGIYSDAWSQPLRDMLIRDCQWEYLFGIENRDRVFPIHRSFKFNPIIVQKGGTTLAIRAAFMRRSVFDWERAEEFVIPYSRAQIERFSPKSHAILEIQSREDLDLLEKIYSNSVLLGNKGENGWGVTYKIEFMMNTDAHLFPPRPQWEAKGYRPDEYSRWLLGDWRPIGELWAEMGVDASRPEAAAVELEDWLFDSSAGPERRTEEAQFVHGHLLKPGDAARTEWRVRCAQPPYDALPVPRAAIPPGVVLSREGDAWIREDRVRGVALPLYQGIMIQPFMPSARGWLSGTGLRAKWDYTDPGNVTWNPQYLVGSQDMEERQQQGRMSPMLKVGFRDISRDTDVRSFQGAILPSFPCGHSCPVLYADSQSPSSALPLIAFLNSFVFDWQTRQRGGAAHLIWGLLSEMALPNPQPAAHEWLSQLGARLSLSPTIYAPHQVHVASSIPRHAVGAGERRRLRPVMDAMAAIIYGLDGSDLRHILQEADLPTATLRRTQQTLNVCGFWRVDRNEPPELRHTVLTQVAFHHLSAEIAAAGGDVERGQATFLHQNHGDGWLAPEHIRLADYRLGHDDRAQTPQPVATRLGPRFYDWQLAQSADEAHRECQLHSRNLLGELEYTRSLRDAEHQPQRNAEEPLREVAEPRAEYELTPPYRSE